MGRRRTAVDHRLHATLGITIGPKERKVELVALVFGGLPLFVLMAIATVTGARALLVPVVAQTVFVAVLVAYDEARFFAAFSMFNATAARINTL